ASPKDIPVAPSFAPFAKGGSLPKHKPPAQPQPHQRSFPTPTSTPTYPPTLAQSHNATPNPAFQLTDSIILIGGWTQKKSSAPQALPRVRTPLRLWARNLPCLHPKLHLI